MDEPSVAEELDTLARLAAEDYLTSDEFATQKAAILWAATHGELEPDHLTAHELSRLAALLDQGVLTRQEFDTQKELLLWDEADVTSETLGDQFRAEDGRFPRRPNAIPVGWEWVLIVAGALAAFGSLLPWEQVSLFDVSLTRNGFQLGSNLSFSSDGLVTMALGVIGLLVGLTRLTGHAFPRWLNQSPIILGAGLLWVTISNEQAISSNVAHLHRQYPNGSASVGYGLWLAVFGGALIAFAGLAGWLGERNATRAQCPHVGDAVRSPQHAPDPHSRRGRLAASAQQDPPWPAPYTSQGDGRNGQ